MALVTVQRSPSAGSSPPASEYGGSYVSQEEEAAENNRSLSEYYFAVKGFGVLLPRSECSQRSGGGCRPGGGGGGVRTSSAPQDIQSHLQAMLNLLHPGHTLQMAVRLESVHGGRVRYLSVVSSVGRMDHLEAALIGTDLITEEARDRPRHRRHHKSPSRGRGAAGMSDDATSPARRADEAEGLESSSVRGVGLLSFDSPGGTGLREEMRGVARDKKNKEFTGDCDRTNVGGEVDSASEGGEDCQGESDGSDGRTTVIISAANSDKSAATGSKSGNLSDAGFIDVDTSGTCKTVDSESSNSPSHTPFLDVSSDSVAIGSVDQTFSDPCDSSGNNNNNNIDGGGSEGGKSKSEGDRVVKMTIGLVMALLADTHITLDGDGGFSVSSAGRNHIFKPITVQAMWSALQVLHKHCSQARSHCHYQGGLSHDWLPHYERRPSSDQSCVNEWNAMAALLSRRPPSPETLTSKEETQLLIRSKLKEIMMNVDIDEVTSKFIRQELEKELVMDLFKYKSYIDQEMLIILGQMDAATEIFQHVYLGSEWNASNLEELKRNGIGFILNVTMEIDNFFPGMFDYKNIRVYDNEKTDLLFHWEDTYRYINMIKDRGGKVLVHCKMGISRSASVVIAYAMKAYNLTLAEATELVKKKRSCIKPNNAFSVQLKTYQGILDASRQRHNALWRSKSETNLQQQPLQEQQKTQNKHGKRSSNRHNNTGGAGSNSTSINKHKNRASGHHHYHHHSKSNFQRAGCSGHCSTSEGREPSSTDESCDYQHDDVGGGGAQFPPAHHHHGGVGYMTSTSASADSFLGAMLSSQTASSSPNSSPLRHGRSPLFSSSDHHHQQQQSPPLPSQRRQRQHNSFSSSSSDSGSTTAATTTPVTPTSPPPPPHSLHHNDNYNGGGGGTINNINNNAMSSSCDGVRNPVVHSQSGSCHLHSYDTNTGSRRNISDVFGSSGCGKSDVTNGNRCSNPLLSSDDSGGGGGRSSSSGSYHPLYGPSETRRPKSWSPDDRTASMLLPSSTCAGADDVFASSGVHRLSGSLNQPAWRAHVTLHGAAANDNGCAGSSPTVRRSASTGCSDGDRGGVSASPAGLSSLYLGQDGAALPSHLQLSASVRDRITEFETAGSGRGKNFPLTDMETAAGKSVLEDFDSGTCKVLATRLDISGVGSIAVPLDDGDTVTTSSGVLQSSYSPNAVANNLVVNTVANASCQHAGENAILGVLTSKTGSSKFYPGHGIPLLTFDNTLTSTDDYDMGDVIEIPLSATEEVIPYDPLTMKIRSEQQQMMKKHTQQKQLAFKNIQQSPAISSRRDVQLKQSPILRVKQACHHAAPKGISLVMGDPSRRVTGSEAMDTNEALPAEGSSSSTNETVFVPNESITWKSGIVRRQKQDFEELGKSSESVKSKSSSSKEAGTELPSSLVTSSSMSVLNSPPCDDSSFPQRTKSPGDPETCPIVRSKSLKESSSGVVKIDDPFSNTVDRVFAKEEKRSQRQSSSVLSIGEKRDSPSRNSSWGSFDSAVVLADRELPSRQSSWGSCDTRVTGTYPSRNNSFGNFDINRKLTEKNKVEYREGVTARVTFSGSGHSPDTYKRTNEIVGGTNKASDVVDPCSQQSKSGLNRIGSFNSAPSPRFNDGLPTSFSSDQLYNQSLSFKQATTTNPNDDIQLSPSLYRPKISTADLKFDHVSNHYHANSSSSPSRSGVTTTRKVYLPPPCKIFCTDKNSHDALELYDRPVTGRDGGGNQHALCSPLISPHKVQNVFRNQVDFAINLPGESQTRSESEEFLPPTDLAKQSVDAEACEQLSVLLKDRDSFCFRSEEASCSPKVLLESLLIPVEKSTSGPLLVGCKTVADVPLPGTVRHQRRRLETWLHDTSNNENRDPNRYPACQSPRKKSSATGSSAPSFSRSLSSCSMEFSCSPDVIDRTHTISRSLSDKRAKFEGMTYGGRVKKLTRDLEKISSPMEQWSFKRSMKAALRQRSLSLERLSTSPTSPKTPVSSASDSSSSQVMLDQLVVEAQARARDLEMEAYESSLEESTEEISVKSLVGKYEKPSSLESAVVHNKNSSSNVGSASDENKTCYFPRRIGKSSSKSKRNAASSSKCSRPRSDSLGEKFLPPVPQRKSSLDYSVRSPTRSSSQPPHNFHQARQPLPGKHSPLPKDSGFSAPHRQPHSPSPDSSPTGAFPSHHSMAIKPFSGRVSTQSGGKFPPQPKSPTSPKLPPGCPKPPSSSSFPGFSFRAIKSAIGTSNSTNDIVSNTSLDVNNTSDNIISGSHCAVLNGSSNSNSSGCKPSFNASWRTTHRASNGSTSGTTASHSHPLTTSKSNPVLSKSTLFSSPGGNNNNGGSSRGQACSTEMRQKKQQGKTHPLSRLPTRENGLH